jgi:hypothetical protein
MHVYARFYTYDTLRDLRPSALMNIARSSKGDRDLLGTLRMFDQKPTWIEGRKEVDLREVALVLAGGRNSIARFLLLGDGRAPVIHAAEPRVGTYRQTGLLKKNKTCAILTGRGSLAPPQFPGGMLEYEPLVSHLREGLSNWSGTNMTCVFTPWQLSAALCHLWDLDINKVLRDKYTFD